MKAPSLKVLYFMGCLSSLSSEHGLKNIPNIKASMTVISKLNKVRDRESKNSRPENAEKSAIHSPAKKKQTFL